MAVGCRIHPHGVGHHVSDRGHPAPRSMASSQGVEFAMLERVDWFNYWRLLTLIGNVPPTEREQQQSE